jgi:hypothetical protein
MRKSIPRRDFVALLAGSVGASVLDARGSVAAHPDLPWYMKATEMTKDGRLTFLHQPWWPRAKKLSEGQSFTLDLNRDGRPDTIVTRRGGNIIEAIDDSGRAKNIWNKVDTAYVVSYGGTGIVDRMVVYIDNNNDGKADEMEVRYFKDGYLRYAWFGENYDNDGEQIFHLTNWQYDFKGFQSKFRGNAMIYINKYDSAGQSWTPLSECPFAFYDPNHDGLSEVVLRMAAQAKSSGGLSTANDYGHMWQKAPLHLRDIEVDNMRLSYNIDPAPRHAALDHPHFNFGFTMMGHEPYDFPDMRYTNRRRRPPQTVIRTAWDKAVGRALSFSARSEGFSWDEARSVDRWEGQFWIYERRILANTGGPTERWNMRREYRGTPASDRRLYYSGVDKRYHLLGASEMWLEVGHLVGDRKDLEFRAYDTDRDGYFDTWEVFREGQATPARVTRVLDPQARPVPLDREAMMREYNGRILPDAIAASEELIAEMKKFVSSPLAQKYETAAAKASMAERKRYCLDIARELYFLDTRDKLHARDASGDYPSLPKAAPFKVTGSGPVDGGYTVDDTVEFWKLADKIQKFVDDYGAGRYDEARLVLAVIGRAKS